MFTYLFENHGKTVHVIKAESLYSAKRKLEKALGLRGTITWDKNSQKIRVIDTKYVGVRVVSDKPVEIE